MNPPLKCVFAGTPEFAVPPLKALLEAPIEVAAVYTQPDRPAGRGRKPRPSPVKRTALDAGVPVRQPASLRDPYVQQELRELAPDLMVVVAYGLILPPEVLASPRLGCINIHASVLPRWRGAAPIHRAVLAGDEETGVSIMLMDAGLDTGPVLAEQRSPIGGEESTGDLHDRLAQMGAQLLVQTLPAYAEGAIEPVAQDEHGVSYAEKLRKEEARIDWTLPAQAIARQARGLNPWPVAQADVEGVTVRIWEAQALDSPAAGSPGEVLRATREGIDVATGRGVLRLLRLQAPGGRPVAAGDFLNGRPLKPGQRFS